MEAEITELKLRMVNLEKYLCLQKQKKDSQTQTPIKKLSESLSYNLTDSVTAVVGLKEALTSENRVIKHIWIGLLFLGVAATMFYLWQTIDDYLQYPRSTEIKVEGQKNHALPPLLLCPKAWFDTDKALAMNMSLDAFKYSLSYLDDTFENQVSNINAAKQEFYSIYDSNRFESIFDYYKAISPDFEIETPPNNVSSIFTYTCRGCQNSRIIEKTISEHRLCYIFNLRPIERGSGMYSGIRRISIKIKDPSAGMITNSPDWTVYLNPVKDSAITMYPKVTVKPFSKNFINFYEQKFVMMNTKEAPCHVASEEKNYSAVICMTQCHNELYQKFINCRLIWLSSSSSQLQPNSTCNSLDRYPPKNETLFKFFESDLNAQIDSTAAEDCVAQCPRECDRVILDTTLQLESKLDDANQYGNGSYPKDILFRLTLDIKHGVVYQGGVMVLSEKPSYSFNQLVNNIGGTLRLFVGGTVMTFAQLILFIIGYLLGKKKNSEKIK